MTVSPNRTMLPPIWVAACDSQRRRNAAVPEDRERRSASSSARGSRPRSVTRPGRRSAWAASRRAAVSAGSPRVDEPGEPPLEVAALEEHVAAAGLAAQADVGAEAIDQPGVAAARVRASEPDDVAEEQREDGLVRHRRVRVSKARVTVGRDEGPGRRRQLEPVDRRDRDDDVGLGRGELGDDPAGAGQRARQLVGRADGRRARTRRRAPRRRPSACAGRAGHDDARSRPGRRRSRSPRRRRCAAR